MLRFLSVSATTRTRQLAEERVGTLLDGKWYLDAMLGYGGSAAVYAGTHRNGKRGAVKILHSQCAADEQLRLRFLREGYVANKIGHPGSVSIIDDDVAADGTVYLVMELLDGISLDRRGRGDVPRMTLQEVVRVMNDLLDVLAHAHAAGIVHRDIKPANLFVTTSGQLKVLDFGIARLAEPQLEGATQTGLMMGTPAFMPPEQARARWQDVDERSDVWSAGATMLALLLGRRPRLADTANEELLLAMTEPLPRALNLVHGLPPEIANVIDRAVSFQREDRWPNARAMQEALRAALANIPALTLERAEVHAVPQSQRTVVASTMIHAQPPRSERTGPSFPQPNTPNQPISTRRSLHENEPYSDTTNRAVLHSARPGAVPNGGIAIAAAAVFGVATVLAGGLYIRSQRTAHTPPVVAAAPPPVETEPTPVEATPTASPPPAETAPPAQSLTPAAPAAPAGQGATQPRVDPRRWQRPAPSGSANPAKYFDSRF
jgi:eukaryotic-like serine/threonine-protein kinase